MTDARTRAKQAWLMHANGATYVAIAKALKVSNTTAQKYVYKINLMIDFQVRNLETSWFGPSPRTRFWQNFSPEDAGCLARGYSEAHHYQWMGVGANGHLPRAKWERGQTRIVQAAPAPPSHPSLVGVCFWA